jgi:ComF family protein
VRHWQPSAPRCPRCAIVLHSADINHCQDCEDQSPEFDRAVAALDYTAPWSPLLARFKFNGATALATPLGDLLAEAVGARCGRVSLVLPIPLSSERLMERGYNQSWLLTRRVAGRLGLPARHDLLRRRRHTSRLMAMSAEEREQAIHDAFEVTRAGLDLLRGRHVALVDDVMTTGATLNAATRALLDGGARGVSAWVVARTPAPDDGG